MHVAIIFSHIGNYHIARLRAANEVCQARGWKLTAIQSIKESKEHPWGDLPDIEGFELKTLIDLDQGSYCTDLHPESPEAVAAITPCLNTIRPDVLAIPGWGFPLSRAALRWSQRHRVPAVLMSESKYDDDERTWWKEQLKYWLYVRKYSTALVGGPSHKNYLVQLGFESNRIFYGYDAIDNNYFKQQSETARHNPEVVRQQQPEIPDKPYFLSVTRLIPRKNIIRLIAAFLSYRDRVGAEEAWPLVICGSGTESSIIQEMIAENNLEDLVKLPGFLTYQQISSWYGLAGAFVHPAISEQWGLVVNEACAAGLPILCSRTVGACQSLVRDGENGFSFDPQQVTEITRALIDVHSLNLPTRSRMGQTSQQIVDDFGPKQFGKGLMSAVRAATGV